MINKVVLVGRITKDPELRNAGSSPCVNFTLACGRSYTDAAGNRQEQTDFIPCVVWRKQAENLARFIKKGSMIGVEGRIQTRNYEANGETRYVTEVLCDNIQFLEPKSSNSETRQNNFEQPVQQKQETSSYYESRTEDVSEDDLPF